MAPWNSTPMSTPGPIFSRSALNRSTTSSTIFWPSLYLNGARVVPRSCTFIALTPLAAFELP